MQFAISNNKKISQASFIGRIVDSVGKKIKATEGEILRIKIIDYLGDGKLVVDLKGQRIVANSNLMIEADQEIDVVVRSTDNNQIVLQILSEDQNRGGLRTESDGLSNQIELLKQYDDKQNIYFELPLNFDDQKANSIIGFNHQPNKQIASILIAVDLKSLGYIEFLISIDNSDLNCQIVSARKDTYKLIKQSLIELKKNLSKLGYKVGNIGCSSREISDISLFVNHLDTSI
ncbi:MAG: flagellar hook-length control protein FliK [Candidatus Poribacteria bacterium]